METSQPEYVVRHPSRAKLMLSLLILCITLYLLSSRSLDEDEIGRHIFILVWSFGCVAILLWAIYLAFKKPTGLILRDGAIELNGKTLKAEEIKMILFKKEWRHSVIGIKPIGKRIVPIRLCFRFVKDEGDGVAALTSWAEENKVKMLHKTFYRWI